MFERIAEILAKPPIPYRSVNVLVGGQEAKHDDDLVE